MWLVDLLNFGNYSLNRGVESRSKSKRFVEIENIDGRAPIREFVIRELRALETLHLNQEVREAFVHFDVIGLLIHQFKDDFILLLILLVQGLNSDLRESEDSSKPTFMVFVRICCLRFLFLNDWLLRLLLLIIVIILASMLLVHLVLHELLGGTQLRSLRSLITSLIKMLSVRLIGHTQVRLSSTSNYRVLARLTCI